MLHQPKVLLISNGEAESNLLEQVLRKHAALHSVRDLAELEHLLDGVAFEVVFCGWTFDGGTWMDALGKVQQCNPDLPVVIFSRSGGEREWVEVLEAGAFDLFNAPYGLPDIRAVLEQAIDSYEARRSRKAALPIRIMAS